RHGFMSALDGIAASCRMKLYPAASRLLRKADHIPRKFPCNAGYPAVFHLRRGVHHGLDHIRVFIAGALPKVARIALDMLCQLVSLKSPGVQVDLYVILRGTVDDEYVHLVPVFMMDGGALDRLHIFVGVALA